MAYTQKKWLDSLDLKERDLLAIILGHQSEYEPILEALIPENFTSVNAQNIFAAAHAVYLNNRSPIDIVDLAEVLKDRNKHTFEAIGGVNGLYDLSVYCPEVPRTDERIADIKKKYTARQLTKLASDLANFTKNENDPDLIIKTFQDKYNQMNDMGSSDTSSLYDVSEIMPNVYQDIYRSSMHKPGELIGMSTGIRDLDNILLGLQPGRMIVLGARPAMGKTSLALQIASHVGRHYGSVLFFSLEMSKEELVQRLVATEAGVPFRALQTAELTEDLWYNVSEANAKIKNSKLIIDDEPLSSITTLYTKIKKFIRKNGGNNPRLIIIDYLQLMDTESKYKSNSSKNQDVSEISRALHLISKEFNCTVLALSQLSRSGKNREDEKRRPILTDLRDSGSIEQDAHTILFLHRDELYNELGPNQGIAELIVSKHRSGERGTIKLAFVDQFTKFMNLARTRTDDHDEF